MISRALPGRGGQIYKEVTEIVGGYAKLILTEKWIKTAAGWRCAHREGEAGRVVRDDSMTDADELIGQKS